MGSHLFAGFRGWIEQSVGAQGSRIIQFVLTTLVLIWPGRQFFLKGYPALFKGAPDMNSLVAAGWVEGGLLRSGCADCNPHSAWTISRGARTGANRRSYQ